MPNFAANLSLLFTELPVMDRFRAAREAGFDAVEILAPYDAPAQDLRDRMVWNAQTFVLMNAPPPSYTDAPRGFASIAGGEDRFRRDFDRVLRYAGVLKPRHIHVMAGEAAGADAQAAFVANLKWAAAKAPDQSLTIEPLNRVDFPGYFLNDYALAAAVLDAVAMPNVGLQFDTYHAAMIHGDAAAVWDRYGVHARHIQIGSVPGRQEPDRGPFDFQAFFRRLDADGYTGFVSAEYHPRGRTEDGLGWLNGWLTP